MKNRLREIFEKIFYKKENDSYYEVDMEEYSVREPVKEIVVSLEEYDSEGYNEEGYNIEGYDREGYNRRGYNKEGIYKKDTLKYYNQEGYDREGYNKEGYNKEGYNKEGYNKEGYNKQGYNKEGYNKQGYNINGYDREGNYSEEHDRIKKEAELKRLQEELEKIPQKERPLATYRKDESKDKSEDDGR